MSKAPELLLPVGNMDMALSAVHNGADAIYVGMPGFNARGRAKSLSYEEVDQIIKLCHLHYVKVHIAFNILIFEDEIYEVIEQIKNISKLRPDAIIVQDIGLIRLIKLIIPDQVIHGSTQMTVTNYESIKLLDDLSINRFVLGRENTIEDIKLIKANTDKEIEVFVHGALCVAYSGQCFTSESLGGRSANRGQCAQSCRFEYDLYVDNKKKQLIDQKYLVSPQDLCGIEHVSELIESEVDSFKVEGRLKGAEYVASVAKNYKNAINNSFRKTNLSVAKDEMALTFSRGFYPGWLKGVAHQELVLANNNSNIGSYVGVIKKISKKQVTIETDKNIQNGDGLTFLGNNFKSGSRVYSVKTIKSLKEISLASNFDFKNLKVGHKVYKSSSPSIFKTLNKTFQDKSLLKKVPVNILIEAEIGKPIKLTISDAKHKSIVYTFEKCEPSNNVSVSIDTLKNIFKTLGTSSFKINHFELKSKEQFFISNKSIKELKRKAINELTSQFTKISPLKESSYKYIPKKYQRTETNSKLNILLRKIEQVQVVCELIKNSSHYRDQIDTIILDFEFGRDYKPGVEIVKKAGIKCGIATTRILKPNEYHNFNQIMRAKPEVILIRNLGALYFFQDKDYQLLGDFSLNITNHMTAEYLIGKGLKSICASYDLNLKNLNSFLDHCDTKNIEITVHQYMPEFHMEHCVFAAFLSKGNSFKDCGKPCEKHKVYLQDMFGNKHEIKADQECRNTMFNSNAQSAISFIRDLEVKGVSKFRFEALHEVGKELSEKLRIYLQILAKEIEPDVALSKLAPIEKYGLSSGQLMNKRSYKDRKKI